MAANPFPPPAPDVGGSVLSLAWLWNLVWPALSSAFGAGVVWGASRASVLDHDRRLTRLEDSVPEAMKSIADKIDDNHREAMRMIVSLAQRKADA